MKKTQPKIECRLARKVSPKGTGDILLGDVVMAGVVSALAVFESAA